MASESGSDGRYFTPDEKRFIERGYHRNGMAWLMKYQEAITHRVIWGKIDKNEIEDFVYDLIHKKGGTPMILH